MKYGDSGVLRRMGPNRVVRSDGAAISDNVRQAAELWATDTIRIEYRDKAGWSVRARCVAHDTPIEGWRASSYYTIGFARSLAGAVQLALRGPIL